MKRTILVSLALLFAVFALPLMTAGRVTFPPEPDAGDEDIPSSPSPSETYPSPSPAPPSPPEPVPVPGDAGTEVTILVNGAAERMTLRNFLYGAVPAEMPALYPAEALKAQAVAIRTLALHAAEEPYHDNALLCDNWEHCLAYAPLESNMALWGEGYEIYAAMIREAVDATEGEAVLYDGEPIEAVFFAASPGRTRSAAEVWGAEVPYLQSVDSASDAEFPGGAKGHGVGMSQFGARQMALEGFDYKEILRWYYTGVEITAAVDNAPAPSE